MLGGLHKLGNKMKRLLETECVGGLMLHAIRL